MERHIPKLLEVQQEVSIVSNDLGSHVICPCHQEEDESLDPTWQLKAAIKATWTS